LLMLLGTASVLLVERPVKRQEADRGAASDALTLQQSQLAQNR
jgi:hypothetical protein